MRQAKRAFDLTCGYAKAGKSDAAKEIFQRLEELAKDKVLEVTAGVFRLLTATIRSDDELCLMQKS